MFYSNLIKNKKIWSLINNYFINNKLPHSFLFYGNSGIGKEGHAIELAALINCKNRLNDEACSQCDSCLKLKSMQHPNLNLIIPYPRSNSIRKQDPPEKALGKKDLADLIKYKKLKGSNPYQHLRLNRANTILLNSIKNVKKEIYNTNVEDGWKIVLIFEAEKLCIPSSESANALLKILEEPPDKTIFILVTNYISQIIDTIKSRCQCLHFSPITFNDIKLSIKKNDISDNGLKLLIQLSNGNYPAIQNLLKSKNIIKEKTILIFKHVYNKSIKLDDQYLINLNKDEWENTMKLLILIYRDILILSNNCSKDYLTLSNFYEKYQTIITNNYNTDWNKCIQIIEKTNNYIKQNGYFPLLMISMDIEINRVYI